jgi:hypothetical protein
LTQEVRERRLQAFVFRQSGGVNENRINGMLDLCEKVDDLASQHLNCALRRVVSAFLR